MAKKSNTRPRTNKILAKYRQMRDPKRTPEPFTDAEVGEGLRFVIQVHDATRLHYDLRLEWKGVLVSFAVPRGIPELGEKHLAVHTEPHPLSYLSFEGFIPKGEYGGGEMVIWDRGKYVPLGDPDKGLEDGKLLFELDGNRAKGVFTLVRTKPKSGEKNQWLLIRKPDGWKGEHADDTVPMVVAELQQLKTPKGTPKIVDIDLMLATLTEKGFSDPRWLFELKYDGYRLLAGKQGGKPKLRYRHGNDVTDRFIEIAAAIAMLPCKEVILDGELVALKPDGHPDFHALEHRAHLTNTREIVTKSREIPLTFMAFDLLSLEGYDLRTLPLERRKHCLQLLLRGQTDAIRYAAHIEEAGEALLQRVASTGLEGIVGKDRSAPYIGGRSELWRKIRILKNGEFAVIGYGLPEKRGRTGFNSLLLAAKENGELRYFGRVGTGFDNTGLDTIRATLDANTRDEAVVQVPAEDRKNVVWVEPSLVVQVRYASITREGRLRQPVFERLREDLEPEDVSFDSPAPEPVKSTPTSAPAVKVSNPDKVFFPALGLTKADLVAYYRAIAPWALPYYKDRPAVLTRFPDGIDGKSFFQKDAPGFAPAWLRTVRIYSDGSKRDIDHFVLDDAESLAYVANLATIPIHVWSSRVDTLDDPDYTVIDLDPKTAPFSDVIALALELRKVCESIDLPHFVKTTGSSGLHVMIPLQKKCSYAQSRLIAELISRVVVARHPQISTLEREPSKRKGRVYLDCLQNGHGKTIAGPYCVRPVPEASVSMPLHWAEVSKKLTPRQFTMKNALQHVRKWKEDPLLPVLVQPKSLIAAMEKLQALL